MIPTDTSRLDAPAPAVRPPSPKGAWLSRRDWQRAVRRWALGEMDRAALDALKARLARVRAADASPPRPAPRSRPPLLLLRGGLGPTPGAPRTAPGGPARAA
ncbi:MAG TPA: hypothetical protein VFF02_02335 [Anaeromyxobacteraceae bacterium]|nr:hypothetical protein [Anaeromyxobacteraceae bacterium]